MYATMMEIWVSLQCMQLYDRNSGESAMYATMIEIPVSLSAMFCFCGVWVLTGSDEAFLEAIILAQSRSFLNSWAWLVWML